MVLRTRMKMTIYVFPISITFCPKMNFEIYLDWSFVNQMSAPWLTQVDSYVNWVSSPLKWAFLFVLLSEKLWRQRLSRLLRAATEAAEADDDDDRLQWINPPHGVIVSFAVEKYILDCHDYTQCDQQIFYFLYRNMFAKCKWFRVGTWTNAKWNS